MSRKQRIIVSITGIVLVSLILVGLTYGYYLTTIKGNTNSKSISVTTANLYIEYNDNNDIITGDKIEPGTTLPSKTFTVTNKGTENVSLYSVGLVNIVNTFKNTKDVVYTLSCNSSVTNKECNGVEETEFPKLNSYIVNNSIDKDEIQTYTLTVTYKETGIDQSDDMNKELSAKIDIFDPKSLTIQGNVTNSSENDYVVIHSKEQESNIVDGSYRFIGITPDTHTITIKNRKTTDTKSTTLDVEKGTPSVSGSKIIYDEDKNIANGNILINDKSLTFNIISVSAGDTTPPNDAIIVLNNKFPTISSDLMAEINLSDDQSKIDLSSSKWLINLEKNELKDKNGYTWNSFKTNPETINIGKLEENVYYLHIISVDSKNNTKETIKIIDVLPEYDISKNNEVVSETGTKWTEGKGTIDSPYLINNIDNLKYLSYKVNSGIKYTNTYFALNSNINFSNDSLLKEPIGFNSINYFDGIFDGGNFLIDGSGCDGLTTSTNFVGIFGVLGPNAVVSNLKIQNFNIYGTDFVGIIGNNMGKIKNVTAENCIIRSNNYTGGLVGYNSGVISSSITNNTIIENQSSYVAGFVGYNIGEINESSQSIGATIYASNYAAGGVGYNKGKLDGLSVNSPMINATQNYGSLVGFNKGTITSNNYIEGTPYTD